MQLKWLGKEGLFTAAETTDLQDELPPGVYGINSTPQGIFFEPVAIRDDELLRFPDSSSDAVVREIERFWATESIFRRHELPYKRGILLYGPPGSGKSCTLQLIARGVIASRGIVMLFTGPMSFVNGYRIFRRIQPKTPLVVLMEDLDTIIERSNETQVLNLLDGVELVDKTVFLATTNYPERLGARIINRPSRFDRRFKIPHPGGPSRELYLRSLMLPGDDVDVARYVADTERMSLAHVKELFIGTVVMGGDYHATLVDLKKMSEKTSSVYDEDEFLDDRAGIYA